MESDRSSPQLLTPQQKIAIFQWLLLGAAISVMVFLRQRMGYRVLKPLHLLGAAILMGGMALFGLLGNGLSNAPALLTATNPLLNITGMGVFVWGMIQRHRRWKEIQRGEQWHTYGKGTSWLEYLPFWPAFLRREDRICRFLDPLLCFILGVFCLSHGLAGFGLWLLVAGFCLFGYEALAYEASQELILNMYDGRIENRASSWLMSHLKEAENSDKLTQGAQSGGGAGVALNQNGFLVYEPQLRERILREHEEDVETQTRQRADRAAKRESERLRRAEMHSSQTDAATSTESAA